MRCDLPEFLDTVEALEEYLTRPTPEVIEALAELEGDLLILGVGGKMGPTLAQLARRASDAAGVRRRIIGVSRFSSAATAEALQHAGVETIPCDLLDEGALAALPDAPNVIYMAGTKFGTTSREGQTWTMNAFLPGLVARRFRGARTVVFSSGNVYPFVPVACGGCRETVPPAPVGEYAQSVLGRERVFEHLATQLGSPSLLFRLNYAVELRYGVILDIAQRVWSGEPISLSTGHVNVLWQGDANAYALQALQQVDVPPRVLNVTGPETISVRALAEQLGEMLDREPLLVGEEEPLALLSNAGTAFRLWGYPRVPLDAVVAWTAAWVRANRPTLGKPTRYQVRNGRF